MKYLYKDINTYYKLVSKMICITILLMHIGKSLDHNFFNTQNYIYYSFRKYEYTFVLLQGS